MKRNFRVFKRKDFDVLNPNVVDNDLLYIGSVLGKVDEVISKTYGPFSGYVAQVVRNGGHSGGLTYTKDGMTTLAMMSFNEQVDIDILNMVRILATDIKRSSGDGSTTATKILSNIIRYAAEDLFTGGNNKYYNKRINSPKAVELLAKLIEKNIVNNAIKVNSTKDILDAAYIALNNDKELLKPFEEIVSHMEEKKVELNDDLEIGAFRSSGEKTTVNFNPGFNLGAKNFVGDSIRDRLETCQVILISNYLTFDYCHFILSSLIQDANMMGRNTGVPTLFIVSRMDNECKKVLKDYIKKYKTAKEPFYCEFLELEYVYDVTDKKREDLQYFLNIEEINLLDFVEKRPYIPGKPNGDNDIDTVDTSELFKWKGVMDDKGKFDNLWGLRKYFEEYETQYNKGAKVNIKYIEDLGLTITPVDKIVNESYDTHIEELKRIIKDEENPDIVARAKVRLGYMKEAYYSINVGHRNADGNRLFDAFNDATRAVNAMMKKGYHMGGSIGATLAIMQSIKEIEAMEDSTIKETMLYIADLLLDSFTSVIEDLLIDNLDWQVALQQKIINTKEMTYYGTRVINPVLTDIVMIKNVLYQFSMMYSSLSLELDNPQDTFHIKRMTKDIKEKLSKIINAPIKKEEVLKEPKPVKEEVKIVSASAIDPATLEEKDITHKMKDIYVGNDKVIRAPNKVNVVFASDDIKKVDKVEEVATPVVAPIKEPEEVVPVTEAKPEPIKKEEGLTEFEKKKKALEEEFKRTEKILREDEFFREEFGVSDRGSLTFINKDGTPDESNVPVGNLDELIEELKHPTIKEEKIVEKNGISISISYPERIEAESLEKIKSGIWE